MASQGNSCQHNHPLYGKKYGAEQFSTLGIGRCMPSAWATGRMGAGPQTSLLGTEVCCLDVLQRPMVPLLASGHIQLSMRASHNKHSDASLSFEFVPSLQLGILFVRIGFSSINAFQKVKIIVFVRIGSSSINAFQKVTIDYQICIPFRR